MSYTFTTSKTKKRKTRYKKSDAEVAMDIALALTLKDIGCSWIEILIETGYYVGGAE